MYRALATAPITMPIRTNMKKTSGITHPYLTTFPEANPKPNRPMPLNTSWGRTSQIRNSGSYLPLLARISRFADQSEKRPDRKRPTTDPMKAPV